MSEPGSYEHELAKGAGRAPVTRPFRVDLTDPVAAKVDYEELRELVILGATMMASGTPLRILLRRMQAIRTFEQEG